MILEINIFLILQNKIIKGKDRRGGAKELKEVINMIFKQKNRYLYIKKTVSIFCSIMILR